MINIISLLFIIIGFIISIPTGCLILLLSVIYYTYTYYQKKKYNNDIQRIINQIDEILNKQHEQYIQTYKEGNISVLENKIHKLVLRLNYQNSLLEKEKNTIKESLEDVSHQIKTPLTSLNLIIERLKDQDLSPSQRNEILKEEIKLLDRIDWLVQSLLKLAQMDASTVKFSNDDIDCRELMNKVISPFEILMDLKNIDIEYQYHTSIIHSDMHWLIEALSNIVKNCIEELNGGKITIIFDSNPLYEEIIISDNGKGISNEDLPHLFERFYKGKNSKGAGIGLALTKKIIESQNGTISVENNYPGAKFIIHFYKEVI